MVRWVAGFLVSWVGANALAFAPTEDQAAVSVRYASADRNVLVIEGQTYTVDLDLNIAAITHFRAGDFDLIGEYALLPTINTGAVKGPGRINIYRFGTQMYEVHLRDLHWTDLDADIEIVLYCYAKRVFANLNIAPRNQAPDLDIGWLGSVAYSVDTTKKSDDYAKRLVWNGVAPRVVGVFPRQRTPDGQGVPTRAVLKPLDRLMFNSRHAGGKPGTRTAAMMLLAGESHEDLVNLVCNEARADEFSFDVTGGHFDGYQFAKGFYQITTEYRGPRGFEEAWINPNERYEVDMKVACAPAPGSTPRPAELICNVRNTYGVLEAAVLTDSDGYPLPEQVQVSKNFAGENEEGKEEGDLPYGEAYVPITVTPDQPFEGRVYHLFGNWGTHPLKQISSIRFFHHYFHASLGPTETFCYVPFEYPREDDRNYLLADVRGLSNTMWPGQPQHDHVSVVGALRYKSEGKWVNNLLQDTRIYLTSPNLASFALDYLSEDGKIKTTYEIFEVPQDDEARSFMKMMVDVLEPVDIDGGSAQNLRFLNAGAYLVHTTWPHIAYTNRNGETAVVDVPGDDSWVLEGEPLGAQAPFVAAYAHKNGNLAFVVNRMSGTLGGKQVDSFGLSCFGAKDWTEMFLTAPGNLTRLEKGDRIEAHLFVMPYGNADSDYKPAERQRLLYGDGLARVEVAHGEAYSGYPRRMKADPRGFVEFTMTGGDNWTPFLVEGFTSHRGPMLWEERGGQWLFVDQQIYGNDWYQSYRAADGSTGFVFVVKLRPGQTHRYVVATAPQAHSITQHNGFVAVNGGPMEFISPVKFADLTSTPVEGTSLFRCTGNVDSATSE